MMSNSNSQSPASQSSLIHNWSASWRRKASDLTDMNGETI